MEIKNGMPAVNTPAAVSAHDAKPGHVYRHRSHVYDSAPYLYLRTMGGGMMTLDCGAFDRSHDEHSRDWIEVEAHVTYMGDKK